MLGPSALSQNVQKQSKSKKIVPKEKKRYNQSNDSASEMSKVADSSKIANNPIQKLAKTNITKSNKNDSLSKHQKEPNEMNTSSEGKAFVSTSQDFPELKVYNNSSLSKFSATNNTNTGYNKSWGLKGKNNEAFPPITPLSDNVKNETDFNKKKEVTPNVRNSNISLFSEKHLNTNLKEERKETTPVQESSVKSTRNPNKKKRTDPVLINLHDALNRQKSKIKKGRIQKVHKTKFQRHKDTENLSGNYLDSSNPKRLRGKFREVKKQELSNLKLAIIKERIIKQKLREQSIASFLGSENVNFIDDIDFKTEIKEYLMKRKSKQANLVENKIKANGTSKNSEKIIKKTEKVVPVITPTGKFKFSSKFREYCDNIITPELNSAVHNLIKEIVNLQDKAFLRDPIKARARKRHVTGIREVKKYLTMEKVKLIVIAPNLENLQMEGSLYDLVNELKSMACEQSVPYVFALDRFKMGRSTKKNTSVSAFAILSYEGVEELFHKVLDLLKEAKQQFNAITRPDDEREDVKTAEVNSKILNALISALKTELKVSDEKNINVEHQNTVKGL